MDRIHRHLPILLYAVATLVLLLALVSIRIFFVLLRTHNRKTPRQTRGDQEQASLAIFLGSGMSQLLFLPEILADEQISRWAHCGDDAVA